MVYVYRIYSKDNCPWCDKAKTLLSNLDIPYEEMKLGRDYTKDDLIKLVPEDLPLTVPQVFVYDTRIGGYEELKEYLEATNVSGARQ
jgi:glutaredoxin